MQGKLDEPRTAVSNFFRLRAGGVIRCQAPYLGPYPVKSGGGMLTTASIMGDAF